MTIDDRLLLLRETMHSKQISAYIIPTSDPHQSEYVPLSWSDREWISGFTGSAGMAIVTNTKAAVWTDARYFIQAEEELSTSQFELHKQIKRYEPEHLIWLGSLLDKGDTIAVNGWNFTISQVKQLRKFFDKKGIKIVFEDLISLIWKDRPATSNSEIYEHDIDFCGQSRMDKMTPIRHKMNDLSASHYVITALDEIAWLTNLRGNDVDYNPVFVSYCILTLEECHLFVNYNKIPSQLQKVLSKDGVHLHDYDFVEKFVSNIDHEAIVLLDEDIVNQVLYTKIKGKTLHRSSLVQHHKGIKNDVELSNWDNAMVKDGVALTHAFFWLENTLEKREVSEIEFGNKLAECRSEQEHYVGESFPPIVGYNGNGAIIHYHAEAGKCKMISKQGVLLVDSGGQYLDGTTDITRTISLSEPSAELKNHYTLVLKGMIDLTQAIFPIGTTGGQLDLLARQHLWSEGLDYPHGTGHGVGYFLNVHEGPQGFAPITTSRGRLPFEEGMITTNEPGYYIPNKYGIRIENLMITRASKHRGFLKFETNTLFPIDQKLIDETRMDAKEKAWFNKYHYQVYEKLSPHLDGEIRSWLKRKCKPLN